jgi:hypothetical protein
MRTAATYNREEEGSMLRNLSSFHEELCRILLSLHRQLPEKSA